jgi:hypothetical protein
VLWQFSRRLIPEDVDHEFDRTLRVNRAFLDQIGLELIEEMPDELVALREEVNTEIQQAEGRDSGTPGDEEDRPDGGLDEEPDGSSGGEGRDDVDHDDEEGELETLQIRPGRPSSAIPMHSREAGETGTIESVVRR